ncbi:SGNH/GDSL hydrolase family protein [Nocardioides nanhaiensis]|uniref:SGNH hydrolase-type esterase domain-containing protein n=1 Tax=Nocardioides nanhaiensis TaxID=1476871 RepID=A0ABP8WQC5_9ACTN
MSDLDLPYDNRTGRGPGRVVRALGLVVPGINRVRAQAEPYADEWSARNREALGMPGRRWIALGDSMSQGVGASSPDAGLVGLLAGRLADAGHELRVVNLSATGARVSDLVEQQVPVMQALPPSDPAAGPDLVTVVAGSNDLFGGRQHSSALPDLMRRLVGLLPRGAVVATLPQPSAAAREANTHLDDAARHGHVRLVDLRTSGPTSWKGMLAPDFFHPNDRGYAAMAEAFEPVLLAALQEDQ